MRRLDVFTVKDLDGRIRRKVYINRESPLVERAVGGEDFFVKALAAVIVHELAHVDGAGEAAARVAGQRFLEQLIARGVLPKADGQRYLAELRHQPAAGAR